MEGALSEFGAGMITCFGGIDSTARSLLDNHTLPSILASLQFPAPSAAENDA